MTDILFTFKTLNVSQWVLICTHFLKTYSLGNIYKCVRQKELSRESKNMKGEWGMEEGRGKRNRIRERWQKKISICYWVLTAKLTTDRTLTFGLRVPEEAYVVLF